jgi:radical SAM protein with 4Fe4S-binding SPASM domain
MVDTSSKTAAEEIRFALDSRPYAPPEVFSKELEPGAWILLDPEMPNWIVVDPLGKEIAELCDGKRDLKEIIEILCRKYNGDFNSSQDNIVKFADMLAEKNFLSAQPFTYYPLDKSEWKELTSLWINVTHACNLRCLHCFRTADEALKNEMNTQEIYNIIDEFVRLKGHELVISGGEPFTRKDIINILSYAKERGVAQIQLLTNGTLVTADIAKALKKLEPIYVQVSIDGATKETHDRIRGEGSFEKVTNGVRRLKDAGFSRILVAAMTILKLNLHEIEDFVSLAEDLGIQLVHFPVFQTFGRGFNNRELLKLSLDDLQESVRCLSASWREHRDRIAFSLSPEIFRFISVHKKDYCGAGIGLWSIEPDGRVTACSSLTDPQFTAGNIRAQSLGEIIYKSSVTKKFRSLSIMHNQKCASCELRFLCGGGCHVTNYIRYRSLAGIPANCEDERTWFWEWLKQAALENIRKEVQA